MSREDAYRLASDCPLCIEFVDFVSKARRLRSYSPTKRPELAPLVEETKLNRLLDRFNLYVRQRVMTSFDEVVRETLSKLRPGEKMKLLSMGELLEAHYPYAFHEVINAVKRGVNLEYILNSAQPGKSSRDIDLLRINLSKAVGDKTIQERLPLTIRKCR